MVTEPSTHAQIARVPLGSRANRTALPAEGGAGGDGEAGHGGGTAEDTGEAGEGRQRRELPVLVPSIQYEQTIRCTARPKPAFPSPRPLATFTSPPPVPPPSLPPLTSALLLPHQADLPPAADVKEAEGAVLPRRHRHPPTGVNGEVIQDSGSGTPTPCHHAARVGSSGASMACSPSMTCCLRGGKLLLVIHHDGAVPWVRDGAEDDGPVRPAADQLAAAGREADGGDGGGVLVERVDQAPLSTLKHVDHAGGEVWGSVGKV